MTSTASAVVGHLDELDTTLGSVDEPEIFLAWTDLNQDVRSPVDDAIREAHWPHLQAARDRIDGFRERFESHDALAAAEQHRKRIVGLEDLRSHLRHPSRS